MISLLDVNAYAVMTLEYLSQGDKSKAEEIVKALETKCADRKDLLNKLEAKASESGSDNAWNRYEAADEAYGYAEELSNLVMEFAYGDTDYDDIEWQVQDIADRTKREAFYRLERAQW
jgi:hypothetical protein